MRQDSPGIAVFDDQDSEGGLATVLCEEAIVHCGLRDYVFARDGAHVRGIGHSPTHTVRAPRAERHM
eukprot:1291035-Alexandrium_andersonii.AAC.1